MVRIQFAIDLDYALNAPGVDFVFNIHAAQTPRQRIVSESLQLTPTLAPTIVTEPHTAARFLRLHVDNGPLHVAYRATLDIDLHLGDPDHIPETPVNELPLDALAYIYPSRYCQSDRLAMLAISEFGHLPKGYRRVETICQWVNRHVTFRPATSSSTTSAIDTLIGRVGVCRDFAHLMIAICRALNIPARFTTGIDYGADPALGPTDFHAYVEVFLDQRWYIFDPSGTAIPMGFVRIGTGRDAADVSYATIFGSVNSPPPLISISALTEPGQAWQLPQRCPQALSTDTPVATQSACATH
ncbi:transglutaminase-like domain-containing protein [Azonexus caeni]|uniref:transglutaminase-like domain-containing protein n=1 Tax=Azonexus caeni TaxID=266126 RepID=UPI003A8A63BA